jgi:hypothetical protein
MKLNEMEIIRCHFEVKAHQTLRMMVRSSVYASPCWYSYFAILMNIRMVGVLTTKGQLRI